MYESPSLISASALTCPCAITNVLDKDKPRTNTTTCLRRGFIFTTTSQIPQNKIRHHLIPMFDEQRIGQAMSRFGIDHQLKLLPGFLQFVNELNRVGQVNVVVDCAVN